MMVFDPATGAMELILDPKPVNTSDLSGGGKIVPPELYWAHGVKRSKRCI